MNVEQLLEQSMTKEAGVGSQVAGSILQPVGNTTIGGGLGAAATRHPLGAVLGAFLGLGANEIANTVGRISAANKIQELSPVELIKLKKAINKQTFSNIFVPGRAARNNALAQVFRDKLRLT